VRISADHESTGESIIFKDDLMNNARTGFPESEAILKILRL